MTMEKKKSIIFTVGLAIIALAIIGVFIISELKSNGTIATSESKQIMNDFNAYMKKSKKEKQVIYYASTSCGYCELETPILETISDDYDMDYVYIDSSKLSVKQRNEVLEKLDIEHATPTTVIVEKGKPVAKAIGYKDGQEYVQFFKDNGMIPEDAVYSSEQYITFIDYSEYEDIIDSGKLSVVVIGQTTCSHCIAIKPALNSVAGDYDITINYLNLTKMTQEEKDSFFESLKSLDFKDEDFVSKGSFGTPTILVIKSGKIQNYLIGEYTTSQLARELKKFGVISE